MQIISPRLLCVLTVSFPFCGQAVEFMMPSSPTLNVSSDFASVPADNLRTFDDPLGLGDAVRPLGASAAWDLMKMTFAYDRTTNDLWVGVEFGSDNPADGVDFATPGAGSFDSANLGFGEFLTGAIDLNNDGLYDLWFGVPEAGTDADFATALYVGNSLAAQSTLGAFDGYATSGLPTNDLGISSWVSSDSVNTGESAFQFKLALGSNPVVSALLPDPTLGETIFNLQFDTGSQIDTGYGEDRAIGTISFPAISTVPEPSSAGLLLLGGILALRRRRG